MPETDTMTADLDERITHLEATVAKLVEDARDRLRLLEDLLADVRTHH